MTKTSAPQTSVSLLPANSENLAGPNQRGGRLAALDAQTARLLRPVDKALDEIDKNAHVIVDSPGSLLSIVKECATEIQTSIPIRGFKHDSHFIGGKHFSRTTVLGIALQEPAPVTADFILKCNSENVKLAEDSQLQELRLNSAEQKRIYKKLEENGHTHENRRRLVEEDEKLAGTSAFRDLRHKTDERDGLICANLNVIKRAWDTCLQEPRLALAAIGVNILRMLDQKLRQQIKTELQAAIEFQLYYVPTIMTVTLFSALDGVREQVRQLQSRDKSIAATKYVFFGVVQQLLEQSEVKGAANV